MKRDVVTDHAESDHQDPSENSRSFDELFVTPMQHGGGTAFNAAFRGYDKDEVDAHVTELTVRLQDMSEQLVVLNDRQRQAGEKNAQSESTVEKLQAELDAANAENDEIAQRLEQEAEAAGAQTRDRVTQLEAELVAAEAKVADAENRVQALSDELVSAPEETANRHQFEEVLRVAEDQANMLLRNATVQGERLLTAAREEIENRRKETQAEADAIIAHAQHDAQQSRLRMDTEFTAHQARIEREAAHATEKITQAEQEASAVRTGSEKGAAALRSLVARETTEARSEAEETVRELRVRALDFESSLTRRQDDAQQEFLMLHNQAVSHAERITRDANDQVAASLEHAKRVAAKADDFERLVRAQAQQIEIAAQSRAHETLDRARSKAQKIIDTVTEHSQSVLRDAEDRTRQLRWQQHQLTSFMSEVNELIRPEGSIDPSDDAKEPSGDEEEENEVQSSIDVDSIDEENTDSQNTDSHDDESVTADR
ncbi:hypothetical protein ACWPKO_26150 (plasmid) [Coraliomargarita sp. W4R53]